MKGEKTNRRHRPWPAVVFHMLNERVLLVFRVSHVRRNSRVCEQRLMNVGYTQYILNPCAVLVFADNIDERSPITAVIYFNSFNYVLRPSRWYALHQHAAAAACVIKSSKSETEEHHPTDWGSLRYCTCVTRNNRAVERTQTHFMKPPLPNRMLKECINRWICSHSMHSKRKKILPRNKIRTL